MSTAQTERQASNEAQEAAFYALKPLLDARPKSPSKVSLDIAECVRAGLLLQEAVEQPEVAALMDELSPNHFDPVHRERMPLSLYALLYVKMRLQHANVEVKRASLPKALVDEARGLLYRYRRLCDYYFDEKELVKQLKDIRKGNSHRDMVYDLNRYANILETHKERIQHDTRYYSEGDLIRGPKLAIEVAKHLRGPRKREWRDYLNRVFGVFTESYGEVRTAAVFVTRHTQYADDFPPLYSVARKHRKKKKTGEGDGSGQTQDKKASKAVKETKTSPRSKAGKKAADAPAADTKAKKSNGTPPAPGKDATESKPAVEGSKESKPAVKGSKESKPVDAVNQAQEKNAETGAERKKAVGADSDQS